MQLEITNFRRVSRASIDISSIALVAGKNESGKTSTAQALAAAMTGETVPIDGLLKSNAGSLVHTGATVGTVKITGPVGSTTVQWPSTRVKTEGDAPPSATLFAMGLRSIPEIKDAKERSKILQSYLMSVPTKNDLDTVLSAMSDKARQAIWDRIQKDGWDAALKYYETQRATLKGQWLEVTGQQYGSQKAKAWLPDEYAADLDGCNEDILSRLVTDAKDTLEAALKSEAVDDSKRSELSALASGLPGKRIDLIAAEAATIDPALENQLKECIGFIDQITEKRDAYVLEYNNAVKEAHTINGQPCPKCGAVLNVVDGYLVAVPDQPEDRKQGNETTLKELENKVISVNEAVHKHHASKGKIEQNIEKAKIELQNKIRDCRRSVDEAEQAEKTLQSMGRPNDETSTHSVNDCRVALSTAESRLKAFKAKYRGDTIRSNIETMDALIPHIAPDGVRKTVLERSLGEFNKRLASICTVAKWRTVEIGPDLYPTYGGTSYLLLSESAKFRVRVAIQLAMAQIDQSSAVAIDAADMLDADGRNGLFKAILSAGMPALVCMTIDSKDKVPNLSKAGIGKSYWMDDGVSEVIQ